VENDLGKTRWGAVIPAGGLGVRMKGGEPKQFINLGHRPVIIHTLARLAACPGLEGIVVVTPAEEIDRTAELIKRFGIGKIQAIVPGGDTRQGSVALGLSALDQSYDYVVVHDGVRPLVDQSILDRVMVAAREHGAAAAGIKVQDTLAEVDKRTRISTMPSRAKLWQVQTPQAFWRPILVKAHNKAWADAHIGTDEAGLVFRMGREVVMVEGSPLNLKVTTKHDLELAEAIVGLREV
jgi:2-C-methyl-D-erythritol 4-phosphate cytidylyltransferase